MESRPGKVRSPGRTPIAALEISEKSNDVARMNVALSIAKIELAYFDDSPDTGTQDCICSYCGFMIGENEVPWRLFRKSDNTEARLCENCQGILNKQSNDHRQRKPE